MLRQKLRDILDKLDRVELVQRSHDRDQHVLLTREERQVLRKWILAKPCYVVRDALTQLEALQSQKDGFNR